MFRIARRGGSLSFSGATRAPGLPPRPCAGKPGVRRSLSIWRSLRARPRRREAAWTRRQHLQRRRARQQARQQTTRTLLVTMPATTSGQLSTACCTRSGTWPSILELTLFMTVLVLDAAAVVSFETVDAVAPAASEAVLVTMP